MVVQMLIQILSLLLDLLTTSRLSDRQKDVEIILLRQQLRILQRKLPNSKPPTISRWDKSVLAVLTLRFRELAKQTGTRLGKELGIRLDEVMLLFKPDTPWLCREPWCSGGIESWCAANGLTNGLTSEVAPAPHLS